MLVILEGRIVIAESGVNQTAFVEGQNVAGLEL